MTWTPNVFTHWRNRTVEITLINGERYEGVLNGDEVSVGLQLTSPEDERFIPFSAIVYIRTVAAAPPEN